MTIVPKQPAEAGVQDDDFELTPEEHAELDESLAQIDRGEYVDGDELLAELRRRRSR